MASYARPDYMNYDNSPLSVFNLSYFQRNTGYVTFADLLDYAQLNTSNIWTSFNQFTDIDVVNTINGVSTSFLDYLQYLPNIITELGAFNYDEASNLTTISSNLEVAGDIVLDTSTNSIGISVIDMNSRVDVCTLDIYSANLKLVDISNALVTTNNNVTTVNNRVTDLSNALVTTNNNVTTVNNRVTDLSNNVLTLSNKITTFNSTINTTNNNVTAVNNRVTDLSNALVTTNNNVNRLDSSMNRVYQGLNVDSNGNSSMNGLTINGGTNSFPLTINSGNTGSGLYDAVISLNASNSLSQGYTGMFMKCNTDAISYVLSGKDVSGSNLLFGTDPGNSITITRMTINKDGNVGIGTNSPSERLVVNGNAIILNNASIWGNASVTGSMNAGSIVIGTTNVLNTLNSLLTDVNDLSSYSRSNINTINNNITGINYGITSLNYAVQNNPKFGYTNNYCISYGTQYTCGVPLQIKFKTRQPTAQNLPMFLTGIVTFRIGCYFYRTDSKTAPGETSCVLALYPIRLANWGEPTFSVYNINGEINGSGANDYYSSTYAPYGRQYNTFSQLFTTTNGANGVLYASLGFEEGYPTYTIYIQFLFNTPNTYSYYAEALDISCMTNNYVVSIGN